MRVISYGARMETLHEMNDPMLCFTRSHIFRTSKLLTGLKNIAIIQYFRFKVFPSKLLQLIFKIQLQINTMFTTTGYTLQLMSDFLVDIFKSF